MRERLRDREIARKAGRSRGEEGGLARAREAGDRRDGAVEGKFSAALPEDRSIGQGDPADLYKHVNTTPMEHV